MGDSPASPVAPQEAEPAESSGQRGLLGRLLSAFSTSDAASKDAIEAANEGASAPRAAPVGIGNLRRLRVEDVATPKTEIVAVPVTIALDALVTAFRESGFSRLPVYKGTLDHPIGLIHMKDLALQQAFTTPRPRFNLRKMLRPLLYAPISMPIGVLLQKMQSERIHMALGIDEYGGVDGLVTIEDLIEKVVGEIEDEHDTAEGRLWVLEKPGQYLVQARVPLSDFEAEIGMNLAVDDEGEEVDTLGGFVFMLSGHVPVKGEVVEHESGASFEIVEADARRVRRIRVRLPLPND